MRGHNQTPETKAKLRHKMKELHKNGYLRWTNRDFTDRYRWDMYYRTSGYANRLYTFKETVIDRMVNRMLEKGWVQTKGGQKDKFNSSDRVFTTPSRSKMAEIPRHTFEKIVFFKATSPRELKLWDDFR